MTTAATTELESINIMLAAIGEAPVNSLTGTVPVDVRLAQSTLTEVNKEIQSEGWSFNTEIDVTLVRDGSNQISLSTDIPVFPISIATADNGNIKAVTKANKYLFIKISLE